MKVQSCEIRFFTILSVVLSAFSRTNNPACIPLRYRKPLDNKPDILVVQYIDQAFGGLMWFSGICRLGNNNENATLISNVYSPEKILYTFDSFTRLLYVGHNHVVKKVLFEIDEDRYPTYEFLAKPNEEGKSMDSMALDWVTKNLYVSTSKFVKVISLLDTSKPVKIIYTLKNATLNTDIDNISIIKVFPNEGYLVVKTSHGELTRLNLDGSKPLVLYNNTDVNITALASDYFKSRVYWMETDYEGKARIRYTTLNAEEPKTLQLEDSYDNYSLGSNLAVDEEYVYYVKKTGQSEYSMFRAGKTNGKKDENFEITNADSVYGNGDFKYIIVLSGEPQNIAQDHPCQNDNGGCSGYCFAIPCKNKKLVRKCDSTGLSVPKIIRNFFHSVIG